MILVANIPLVNLQNFYCAAITYQDAFFFSLAVLIVFFLLLIVFGFGVWISRQSNSLSPYSGTPLRLASDLDIETKEKIVRYLYKYHQYDNRIFEFSEASFCRETGRIFQDSVTWYGVAYVDWNFLRQRCPGNYVSWGSLTLSQQEAILNTHGTLEGYQIEFSSLNPSPRAAGKEYTMLKPGPLYVDVENQVLLGWKEVPGTDIEVLIVQKPKPYVIKVLEEDNQSHDS